MARPPHAAHAPGEFRRRTSMLLTGSAAVGAPRYRRRIALTKSGRGLYWLLPHRGRYVCYSFQMRFNRSVPPCTVIPVLIYPDPGAAADWLSQAFGFTVRLRIANHRIQMKAGDGCFTIAEGTVDAKQLTYHSGPDRGCRGSLRARAAERSHHPDRAARPTLRRAPIQR